MSLINDALKNAQNNQSRSPAASPPPLKAAPAYHAPANNRSPARRWTPAIVVILLATGISPFVWVKTHPAAKAKNTVAARPPSIVTSANAAPAVPAPPAGAAEPAPLAPAEAPAAPTPATPSAPEQPPVNPPGAPKLQGIIYQPGAASAIVESRTVRTGDHFLQYQVREITKTYVLLATPDGKQIRLTM